VTGGRLAPPPQPIAFALNYRDLGSPGSLGLPPMATSGGGANSRLSVDDWVREGFTAAPRHSDQLKTSFNVTVCRLRPRMMSSNCGKQWVTVGRLAWPTTIC
jgi:hypothetical protein